MIKILTAILLIALSPALSGAGQDQAPNVKPQNSPRARSNRPQRLSSYAPSRTCSAIRPRRAMSSARPFSATTSRS